MVVSEQINEGARSSTPAGRDELAARHEMRPLRDAYEYLKTYAREKPGVAALWCFGVGFVLGWKLKPW